MMCANPYSKDGAHFGCGQCMPCRVNKRRTWTGRILVEALEHGFDCCSFLTLTYEDDWLPAGGSLDREDIRGWLKRVRKVFGAGVRHFTVGEYGEKFGRPHYHSIVFGVSPQAYGEVEASRVNRRLASLWHYGATFIGTLSPNSAQYCAGYTTKKMTSADDERLQGRHPEFASMSRRPGLGAAAVVRASLDVKRDAPNSKEALHGLSQYVVAGKSYPLGQYLRRVSRAALGLPTGSTKAEALELQALFDTMVSDALKADRSISRLASDREVLVKAGEQKRLNQAARLKVFGKVEVL